MLLHDDSHTDGFDGRVAGALERLDPADRALLGLSAQRGMSVGEIAEVTENDPDDVAAWLRDGVREVAIDAGVQGERPLTRTFQHLRALDDKAWAPEHAPSEPPPEEPLPAEPAPTERGRWAPTAIYAAMLAAIAALVPVNDVWAAQIVSLGLLITVPGLLFLRAIGTPGESIAAFPLYVPAASLAVLLAAALGVDLIGPHLGAERPLEAMPLLVGVMAVCEVLLIAGALRSPSKVAVPWRSLGLRVWNLWPLALPLLSAAGAARLTAGHGDTLAIAGLALGVVAIFACTALAGRLSRTQLALVLYGVALAAIWSFSLRGHFVYGFDISSEFHVFEQTLDAGIWKTSHPNDAYGAMLSLTVLPALLHTVAGVSALALFKAIYPALFALVPVGIFFLAGRYVTRRFAFIAAAFVAVQSYVFQQMPAIARQEIALLLFVALIAAALDRSLRRGSAWALVAATGLGMVVSHYSTTYLAAIVLGAAVILQLVVGRFRPMPKLVGGTAAAFVALAVGSGVWYGAVTHSTENVTNLTDSLRERGFDLLPNAKAGQGVVKSYLGGNQAARAPAPRFADEVAREYERERPFVKPLTAADKQRYELKDAAAVANPVRQPVATSLLDRFQLAVGQIANLLAIVGAAWLVLSRRTSALGRQLGLIGLATLVVLAMIRLSGTAATAYNQERAFVQLMVPLSIGIAWVLERASKRFRLRTAVTLAAGAALALTFFGTSGLKNVAFGGDPATNLADEGEDYERFYVSEPELAAADWANAVPKRNLVYADRYGSLRILAATGRNQGLLQSVTPRTLDRDAWIYGSRTNIAAGRTRGQTDTSYSVFQWPRGFLQQYWNVMYTNGSSEVYKR